MYIYLYQYSGQSSGILLPNFPSATDFRNAGLRNDIQSNLYYVLYGRLGVTRKGLYSFCVSSIDGTLFEMDGVMLVSNDGRHAYRQECAELFVDSGDHEWVLRGFFGSSRMAMRLEYRGPDTYNSLVPVISNNDQSGLRPLLPRPAASLSWGANGQGSSLSTGGGIIGRQLLSAEGRYLMNVNWDGNVQVIEMQSFPAVDPIRMDTCRDDGYCLLEVLHAGVWGTVCGHGFTEQDAAVACAQLGCADYTGRGAAFTSYGSVRGQATRTGKIWMDSVSCAAGVRGLSGCEHRGWGQHTCNHADDVGVQCQSCPGGGGGGVNSNPRVPYGRTIWETGTGGRGVGPYIFQLQADGNVVLYDSSRSVVWTVGASGWGSSSWSITDGGNVVTSYWNGNSWTAGRAGNGVWYHAVCPAGDNGIARLVGCNSVACRLEVNFRRQWGTVCDDGFNDENAAVVCRSLGFPDTNARQIQVH